MSFILIETIAFLALACASAWVGLLEVRDMSDLVDEVDGQAKRELKRAVLGGQAKAELRRAMLAMHLRTAVKRFATAAILLAVGGCGLVVNLATDLLDGAIVGTVFSVALFTILIWNLAVQLIDRHERRRWIRETLQEVP